MHCLRSPTASTPGPATRRRTALSASSSYPAVGPLPAFKAELVGRLLAAKKQSGKSFTQLAEELGLTNVYTAQLFHRQVRTDCMWGPYRLKKGEGCTLQYRAVQGSTRAPGRAGR